MDDVAAAMVSVIVSFRFNRNSFFKKKGRKKEGRYEKEAIIIFCDIFSSHFQRRSLPQIPSGFPSPIQPKKYLICHVPIPRNPEELVTTALTSILATGGSIPEGYRMESWFQKGDPPIPPIHSNCNMTTWQAYPVLRTWLASASTVTLVIVFSFHSWTRTSNIVPWVVAYPPPIIKYIVMIQVVRGGIIDTTYVCFFGGADLCIMYFNNNYCALPTLWISLTSH